MEKLIGSLLALAMLIAFACWLSFSNEHTVTVTAYGVEKITSTHGDKDHFTTDVYALLEADNTPPCEVVIRKANKGMHEIEIKTETANADYFRIALGGEV